jgi:Competence protein CoiA-like family
MAYYTSETDIDYDPLYRKQKHLFERGNSYPRPTITCRDCGEELELRFGEIVDAYWAHHKNPESRCPFTGKKHPESKEHKNAKKELVEFLNGGGKVLIPFTCRKCDFKKIIQIDNMAETEFISERYEHRVGEKRYCFWDIAKVEIRTGRVIYGIEIEHTHQTSNIEARRHVDWNEFKATEVLANLKKITPKKTIELHELHKDNVCENVEECTARVAKLEQKKLQLFKFMVRVGFFRPLPGTTAADGDKERFICFTELWTTIWDNLPKKDKVSLLEHTRCLHCLSKTWKINVIFDPLCGYCHPKFDFSSRRVQTKTLLLMLSEKEQQILATTLSAMKKAEDEATAQRILLEEKAAAERKKLEEEQAIIQKAREEERALRAQLRPVFTDYGIRAGFYLLEEKEWVVADKLKLPNRTNYLERTTIAEKKRCLKCIAPDDKISRWRVYCYLCYCQSLNRSDEILEARKEEEERKREIDTDTVKRQHPTQTTQVDKKPKIVHEVL